MEFKNLVRFDKVGVDVTELYDHSGRVFEVLSVFGLEHGLNGSIVGTFKGSGEISLYNMDGTDDRGNVMLFKETDKLPEKGSLRYFYRMGEDGSKRNYFGIIKRASHTCVELLSIVKPISGNIFDSDKWVVTNEAIVSSVDIMREPDDNEISLLKNVLMDLRERVPNAGRVLSLVEGKRYRFKPFDKVLMRHGGDSLPDRWFPTFFALEENGEYYDTSGACFSECIPYEGNEDLYMTNKNKED